MLGRGEVAPHRLRIYANHATIVDFSDAESTKPQLDISLLEDAMSTSEYPLRVAAFANVHSLSLFFVSTLDCFYPVPMPIGFSVSLQSESPGGDSSRIYFIGFKGVITSPRKDPNTLLDIPAANAADAPLIDRVSEKAAGQQTTAR